MRAHLIIITGLSFFLPVSVLAAPESFKEFVSTTLLDIANALILVLIALATLVFIYGVVRYVGAGGDAEAIKKARAFIIWSIVGLALILGVWGIARFLAEGILGNIDTVPSTPPLERPSSASSS